MLDFQQPQNMLLLTETVPAPILGFAAHTITKL